ncbi:MAG: hypothetical protein U0R50_11115 [Gaiellales bacterium]
MSRLAALVADATRAADSAATATAAPILRFVVIVLVLSVWELGVAPVASFYEHEMNGQ